MKHPFTKIAAAWRAVLGLTLVLGLAGCPLQTPTFEAASAGLVVTASSAAPLVGDTVTLTALSPAGAVNLASATWTTSDASIVSLVATTGAQIMAHAEKAGTVKVTVTMGTLRGAVTISVLGSIGNVDLLGPTSLVAGAETTYTATVTDASGRKIGATLTWTASGTVALATPGANTGTSMKIRATSVGPGAVTAEAGGRRAQIAVKVSAMSGQLVIERADGSPLPSTLALGDPLTVAAVYEITNGAADDAQWTATGTCSLVGSSGSTLSVQLTAVGSCMLGVTAKGMSATATFAIVEVSGIKITADMGPLAIGEARTLTAVAIAGGVETGPVTVVWSTPDEQVVSLLAPGMTGGKPSGTTVKVTGLAVGDATVVATLAGKAMAMVALTVAPSSIQISATATRVLVGTSATVTAKALGPNGAVGRFATSTSLSLAGAVGFDAVGPGAVQGDGTVTFSLDGAKAASPSVTVSSGTVISNALSFTVATIANVVVMGPQGPVRVGSGVDFTAIPVDGAGARIDGALSAKWTDSTGVYQFPDNNTLHITGNALKLGTAAIVATVMGVSSAPFASPVQPASVGLTVFSPASIAVGGTATAVVTVLDSNGMPIPGVPLSQILIAAVDPTKVSFDLGVVINTGLGFQFTGTGLAATPAAGVMVTATWTDGMYPVDSGAVPLVVTGP